MTLGFLLGGIVGLLLYFGFIRKFIFKDGIQESINNIKKVDKIELDQDDPNTPCVDLCEKADSLKNRPTLVETLKAPAEVVTEVLKNKVTQGFKEPVSVELVNKLTKEARAKVKNSSSSNVIETQAKQKPKKKVKKKVDKRTKKH